MKSGEFSTASGSLISQSFLRLNRFDQEGNEDGGGPHAWSSRSSTSSSLIVDILSPFLSSVWTPINVDVELTLDLLVLTDAASSAFSALGLRIFMIRLFIPAKRKRKDSQLEEEEEEEVRFKKSGLKCKTHWTAFK